MIVAPLLVLAFPSAFAVEPATPEPWLQAVAYGDEDEEEEDDGSTRKKPRRAEDERTIREIVRGFYARANIGAAAYLLNFGNKGNGNAVSAGTMVGLSLGQDFVDNEKQSMAWEVGFVQGIHNGLAWELQAGLCDGASGAAGGYPCTEGDLRTYALQAAYEFSAYPIRRVGIGFRAGGGALYSPFLIDAQAYTEDVIQLRLRPRHPGEHPPLRVRRPNDRVLHQAVPLFRGDRCRRVLRARLGPRLERFRVAEVHFLTGHGILPR
jgi:hypothetical protein